MNSIKFTKEIDLIHSVLRMREDGILQINFGDKTDLDVVETKEILVATKKITEGRKVLTLNIAGSQTSATSAARDFAASEEAIAFTLAEAYVVKNLAQKIIGNFYINFHKPLAKTKIFTNEADAVKWLKGLSF